jgi:hypothetical protein
MLGVLMLIESLALLAVAWRRFDLLSAPGHLETFSFQLLLFFAIFSILSIRERRVFWSSWPSVVLSLALIADAGAGFLIGRVGMAELRPIPLSETGTIIAYALTCALVFNDTIKTTLIARLRRRASVRAP